MDLLVIDRDKTFREATCDLLQQRGHRAQGLEAPRLGFPDTLEKCDGAILDVQSGESDGLDLLVTMQRKLPKVRVVAACVHANVAVAVEAMRRGAVDFVEKPLEKEHFLSVIARLENEVQEVQSPKAPPLQRQHVRAAEGELDFDFHSPPMRELHELVVQAAPTPASILIGGESGTGKSVLARAILHHSRLAHKPFVTVSCPSLSKELLRSQLFGHVKGAFTGAAADHWGKVRKAEGGTLFLDEIGDLPLEIQPQLLRLLQEREYERLGENITRQANVRIIAATNRNLKKLVADGRFREDLYFRLNVIAIEMPPLRQRPDDLMRLAEHYLRHFLTRYERCIEGFSKDALTAIRAHSWPGNLRELRNAVERAVILSREKWLEAAYFSDPGSGHSRSSSPDVQKLGAV
ncbi:MAG: sigma-54-dependent Fis family transcriptional regulator [Verrucomicrobiales bacterium]|nr:sigma-54-dependent Fis family transcriptional regulator [Verrucomicrobiales bacterium]